MTEGKTLVLITHRASLLELVERVIVLDTGNIVADGPKAGARSPARRPHQAGRRDEGRRERTPQ